MSQSSFELASVKAKQSQPEAAAAGEAGAAEAAVAAESDNSAPQSSPASAEDPGGQEASSGAKRTRSPSDDVESPASKRFSAAEADLLTDRAAESGPNFGGGVSCGSKGSQHSEQQEQADKLDQSGSMSQTTVDHTIPDRLVGLMIGKGGESINRLQEESGARIQISTESGGPQRQVTLTGTSEQVDRARQLMDTIVQNAERTSSDSASHGGGGGGGGSGGGQDTVVIQVPAPKVGLLIGKSGETIKSLQDKAGVRMLLIQDASNSNQPEKPLKITGPPDRLSYARELVLEVLNSKDAREFPPGHQRGGGGGGGGSGSVGVFDMRSAGGRSGGGGLGGGMGSVGGGGGSSGGVNFGETYQEVKVPRRCVGVVIGKGGDMLRKINQETGAKVQFRQEGQADRELPERMLQVSGSNTAVQAALERVQHLISAVMTGEIPVTERPRGPDSRTVTYAVPAEKAGLVIGKGGETVKEINRMSGAYVAIQRDAPPNGTTKVFDVQGSPAQINEAIRLICEKAGLAHQPGAAGNYGNGGGGDSLGTSGSAGMQQQDNLPPPQYNSQTGQMDYSLAWAEYYRRQGHHEYADAILRQAAAAGQQHQQTQPQDQQWQQWQQWQAWQNGGQQAAVAATAGQPQQPQAHHAGQQAWGGWQQHPQAAAAVAGAGWDQSGADPSQQAAWGQAAQGQQPDGGQQAQAQNWWYNSGR